MQVQGLAFVAGSSSSTQITISWTLLTTDSDIGGSPILGYTIQSAVDGATPAWAPLAALGPTASQYTATGLTGGVAYIFQVGA